MLFDPFKKEFNLPSILVQLSNFSGLQIEIIGDKVQLIIGFFIIIFDSPEIFRIPFCRIEIVEPDGLID